MRNEHAKILIGHAKIDPLYKMRHEKGATPGQVMQLTHRTPRVFHMSDYESTAGRAQQ